jgi:hypothetical protein
VGLDNITDPHEAYVVASSITTIALNLPPEVVGRIPLDREYLEVWGNRPDYFIAENNYGFLFFNMAHNYKEFYKSHNIFSLRDFFKD